MLLSDIQFKYFYGKESDLFTFYRIPKELITNPRFKSLSNDAKQLYGLMRNIWICLKVCSIIFLNSDNKIMEV